MFASEEDIREAALQRPYRELPPEKLARLLEAFEEFLPALADYSHSSENLIAEFPEEHRTESLRTALQADEPEVSFTIYEILLEASIRIRNTGTSLWPSYQDWSERGLFFGFDGEDLDHGLSVG